jgi:hypothetical protein
MQLKSNLYNLVEIYQTEIIWYGISSSEKTSLILLSSVSQLMPDFLGYGLFVKNDEVNKIFKKVFFYGSSFSVKEHNVNNVNDVNTYTPSPPV